MNALFNLIVAFSFVAALMIPLCIMAWFTEETKIGRRLMNKLLRLLDLE